MEITTACTMDCPDACSLVVSKSIDGSIQIRGNPDHPITAGVVCGKIKKHPHRLTSSHRRVYPMVRKNDHWQTISWDAALDLCAGKIEKYRDNPSEILHIHGEGAKGVLKQAGKLFFSSLGASRLRGSLCDAAGFMAYIHDFGSRHNPDPRDLLNCGKIVNWGKDLSRSSIHLAALVQKVRKNGARVLTISPGGDGNGNFSDNRITIRPGTDRFLAAAAICRLTDEKNFFEKISSCAKNWEDFKSLISRQKVHKLLDQCDVPEKDFEILLDYYGKEKPAATLIGAGLQRYEHGGENVRFINALAMISGNIGQSGGGSYFHLHSLRNLNLDWTKGTSSHGRRSLIMPLIGKEIESADPPIKMIWVNGSNIINQAPDIQKTAEAFANVEFKVVVDAFMTDTARCADLFLPSTLMLEQEDIIASFYHDYVHYVPAAIKPPGEARSDFWIFSQLGKRLNPAVILPDADSCFKFSLNSEHLSVSLEGIRQQKFVRANRPLIAFENLRFDHPDGRYRFPETLHREPAPPQNYPMKLLSLIRRDVIHSQILPEKHGELPSAWVCPETLKKLGLEPNQKACVISDIGKIAVVLKPMKGLYPNTVLCRRGDWVRHGGGINRVIQAAVTDLGNGAAFYGQHVRLVGEEEDKKIRG